LVWIGGEIQNGVGVGWTRSRCSEGMDIVKQNNMLKTMRNEPLGWSCGVEGSFYSGFLSYKSLTCGLVVQNGGENDGRSSNLFKNWVFREKGYSRCCNISTHTHSGTEKSKRDLSDPGGSIACTQPIPLPPSTNRKPRGLVSPERPWRAWSPHGQGGKDPKIGMGSAKYASPFQFSVNVQHLGALACTL
jgi:hypothetical protein